MHFWTCFWLATGRLDWSRNEAGWYKMANFDKGPSTLEMYVESYYYVITTFAGAGFGNVVPSTNAEWFVATGLNLIGSSLFICIFVDFGFNQFQYVIVYIVFFLLLILFFTLKYSFPFAL